jgi:RNA polymerase sigma factor (sigma-70 family)
MGSPNRRGEDWFAAVYAAQYGRIISYGRRRLAEPDAADELAQEVFVVAWRRRAEVPDNVLPWLYGVARRLLANRRRAAPAALPLPDPELMPGPSEPDAVARLTDVRAALTRLSPADQELLRLIGWEELTVAEAATVLGCSRTTAAVRLHRARRRLTDLLASPRPAPTRAPVAR